MKQRRFQKAILLFEKIDCHSRHLMIELCGCRVPPARVYLFKVNNGNTKTCVESLKTSERRQ